ncbi:hypothetical protein P152DRAFT_481758 [Eremomyces bilateralis CBS 781.70]|uniref:Nephrocystin 3-like N-terminal domain-containing protein n=1 Tax=Eremomyces bilateralis CBS 781.70 TaxID=1392243 RepID=A0A6G1G438_9PEZI|nr:uncharacterized protein P152DRAFT_481758 [Eremomyces bilateralis CBS 781.70]KAF1812865.1 hypothetical protein P152DRAFT_481758 [Eremomyces bilateralis CBS 781.70]
MDDLDLHRIDQIKAALKDKKLVIVTGSGVTLNATATLSGDALDELSWTGLINHGLDFLVKSGKVEADDDDLRNARKKLKDPKPSSKQLLRAAGRLKELLEDTDQLSNWLDYRFGKLSKQVRHPGILNVLKSFHENGTQLLTTNYDDLLEEGYCKLTRIGRMDHQQLRKFQSGNLRGVVHLHGSFHDPNDVILDATDYYKIASSNDIQELLRSIWNTHTILFVGCGSGLEDPNFGALLDWAKEDQKNIADRHFLLVSTEDRFDFPRLMRLEFGTSYADLVPFLQRLLDDPRRPAAGPASDCLNSIGFPDINARRLNIADAHPDTCDWLFQTAEFIEWRDRTDLPNHNGVLWIKGKPGVGKSTLMKHALDHLENIFADHSIISYFFNARGGILEKSPLGMLRSIVYQLVNKDAVLYEHFLSMFREKKRLQRQEVPEWQESELKDFIMSEIRQWKRKPLVLLLDALDECNEPNVREVVRFLEDLSIYAVRAGGTLRTCLSSRHYPHVSIKKSLEFTVERIRDHDKDIARYTQERLIQMYDGVDREDIHNVTKEIRERANGIFLWVVLVVSLLNIAYDKGRVEAMHKTLEEVPNDLEELFNTILSKGDEHKDETTLMLQWVLFSRRPLGPEELFFAVTNWIEPKVSSEVIHRRITESSRGLIEVRKGYASVQFIHLSVKDFLLRNRRLLTLDPTLGPEPISASHGRLWACCWACIERVNTG